MCRPRRPHRFIRAEAAFIDADKSNYNRYFDRCLTLVRPGGLILFDNTLRDGRVADPDVRDADARAIRALNDRLVRDPRVTLSLVPIDDGLTFARKR
ncbi:O-methyltransferase family 3 [Thiocapsa marina 5811]|uniref:O-methyltransferase family 3 n=1 Tax=Thiocapsa marina 5811 TaxID=768671 RepID=F9U7C6_9GAMM|nr:O-methyltransferase family 3 [Thiocapsa marina 5811]